MWSTGLAGLLLGAVFHEGTPYVQIAQTVGIDRNVVTAIVEDWHRSRGLPVPDGRARRKELNRKRKKKE